MSKSLVVGCRSRLRLAVVAVAASTLGIGLLSAVADAQLQPHAGVVSDNPDEWTPHFIDGRVNAILQVGDTMIAGGTFTEVKEASSPTVQSQKYLVAFDAATGVIDPSFAPELNAAVEALAVSPDGQSVYVGGSFTTVDGAPHQRLVALDLANGNISHQFDANANDVVQELVVRGDLLYASGKFTEIGGETRSGMARLDPDRGTVDASFDIAFTDPPLSTMGVPEFDITADGSRLIAVGNFSKVAGEDRVQVAMLDLTTDPVTVAPWQTDEFPVFVPGSSLTWCASIFPTYMRDVDFSPDGSYFVIVTTGANRPKRLCDTASRWETSETGAGLKPSWVAWTGGDSIISVGVTGAAVYIGGHNQWVNDPYVDQDCGVCANPYPGAIAREGIAALDPLNGLPYTWDPGRSRGLGVMQFLSTDAGLWVASDTDRLADEIHPKLGFFPLDGGTIVEPNIPYSLPGTLYSMTPDSGQLLRGTYDNGVLGVREEVPVGVNWRKARGSFALNGQLYSGWANGTLVTRSFDGTTTGPADRIGLNGLGTAPEPHTFFIPGTGDPGGIPVPSLTSQLQNMTGMFFDQGRIYYTVKGDPRLYYRYFTPQSMTVGAQLLVASSGDGVPWAKIRGMTMASGSLIYATGNGNLFRVDFDDAPTGGKELIGSPTIDGIDWASRAFFAFD